MRDPLMTEMLRRLALEAGAAIMAVRSSGDLGARAKEDRSPVTEADMAADAVICAGLARTWPGIAIVTEERAASHAAGHASGATTHFLVDPLDGTREFVGHGDDFTVNIALVENGVATAGVVYAPAHDRMMRTDHAGGAVEERAASGPAPAARPLAAAQADRGALRVVASRSHRDAETDAYIAGLSVAEICSAGSSLKFGLLAAGEADIYPRFGPTMEWDTAAGHAVLTAAGGAVLRLSDGAPLIYGKADRRNPGFVAVTPGAPRPVRG